MDNALTLIYYMLTSFFSNIFSMYMFNGVSIGMFFLVCSVFSILLHYVISVPKHRIGRGGGNFGKRKPEKSNTQ